MNSQSQPMKAPLIERLMTELGYAHVDTANHDDFVRNHEHSVLFFTENPARYPESNDVAVVLPELMKATGHRFTPAVVVPSSEKELQKRYGFTAWPALVFLRRGQYLGCLTRILDWGAYLQEMERLLNAAPTRAPVIGIPVVSEQTSGCH